MFYGPSESYSVYIEVAPAGSVDERMVVIYNSLGAEYSSAKGEPAELPYQLLREYCESVASTYIKIIKASEASRAGAWLGKGFRGRAQHVQALGEALAATAAGDEDAPAAHHVSAALISRWWAFHLLREKTSLDNDQKLMTKAYLCLKANRRKALKNFEEANNRLQTDTLLMHLSELVFRSLYGVCRPPPVGAGDDAPVHDMPPAAFALLPAPDAMILITAIDVVRYRSVDVENRMRSTTSLTIVSRISVYKVNGRCVRPGLEAMPDYPAFIDLSHIVWLNSHIPQKHRHKWRFLFSSHIHGESFATMAGRIQDQGASVLIIEDNSGYIFGGYAPSSWSLGPNFAGDEESFLFTLAPRMRMYPSSGFNDHYQYLNHHTKTMPNGLLMGGQLEFGAIWLCADPFGAGSSAESCSTYRGYRRLSKEPSFRVRSLEVWAVGDRPAPLKDSISERSWELVGLARMYRPLRGGVRVDVTFLLIFQHHLSLRPGHGLCLCCCFYVRTKRREMCYLIYDRAVFVKLVRLVKSKATSLGASCGSCYKADISLTPV
ncbi:hypothetical protein EVAR_84280_1 [Eumeta japonica]|uniref:MTOR-associated protein MEAK7 n=1 Tax=Eumeta variegata TaxID=151549 RepID=A0A4C1WQN2_EUMVA|nr:hypothetical protein EVAR_84280_1 [Eumeta japonica]